LPFASILISYPSPHLNLLEHLCEEKALLEIAIVIAAAGVCVHDVVDGGESVAHSAILYHESQCEGSGRERREGHALDCGEGIPDIVPVFLVTRRTVGVVLYPRSGGLTGLNGRKVTHPCLQDLWTQGVGADRDPVSLSHQTY